MPVSDLSDTNRPGMLRPFASFEVLAAMLCPKPEDRAKRRRFLDAMRIDSGLRPFQYGHVEKTGIQSMIRTGVFRGSAAGFLFNSMLDQIREGRPPSLNGAIATIQRQLPPSPKGGKSDGYPSPKQQTFPLLLPGLPQPSILMYPPETVIAEKFEAMIRFGEANGRIKDFYDIWVTKCTFPFDLGRVVEAVGGTLQRRGTAYQRKCLSG